MQTKNINIKVELDNDHIPSSIQWTADDLQGMDRASCGLCSYHFGIIEIKTRLNWICGLGI